MTGIIGRALALWIWNRVPPKREPDFLIGPSADDPYMRRWWIIPRNKIFNIYLHHMMHDDDDRAPHDHPWWSLSLCLNGRIKEHELLPKRGLLGGPQRYRINDIVAGQWKWRGKEYAHRLELPDDEAWTLFMTGPKLRTWGFHCPKGWKPWKEFVDPDNPGNPGRGCGEME